jgi:DNA-3-methyladenine glycosylase
VGPASEPGSARARPGPGAFWAEGRPPRTSFDAGWLLAPVADVARALLGARLVSDVDGERTSGVIVETEAYLGPDDAASHAATRSGVTDRNRVMFGPPGRAYVYRSYGVHWCMNVVVGVEGRAGAVLLRGLEPLEGTATMARRRGRSGQLASGPGRLCQALGITKALYAHDLRHPPLQLLPGWPVPDPSVAVSARIGITRAIDRPLRFFVRGSAGVSR